MAELTQGQNISQKPKPVINVKPKIDLEADVYIPDKVDLEVQVDFDEKDMEDPELLVWIDIFSKRKMLILIT